MDHLPSTVLDRDLLMRHFVKDAEMTDRPVYRMNTAPFTYGTWRWNLHRNAQQLVERRARRRMDSDTITGKPLTLTRVRSN